MKFIIILSLIFVVSCATSQRSKVVWEFKEKVSTPESIYYDKASGFVFVSSIVGDGVGKDGKGHIAKLNKDGTVVNARWIKGLNAPKGMRAHNGKLWVTDINRIVVIDIKKKKIIKKIRVRGAKFLNDIAITPNGIVFVSDSLTSKIHMVKNYKLSTYMKGKKLESPNGLLVKDGNLYVAAWGLTKDWSTKVPGRLYSIEIASKKISYITKAPLGNLDGLEIDNDGNFLVSDWVKGKIYSISKCGKITIVFQGKKGLADIGYISETDTILAPYMLDNMAIGI